ncbi:MAG: hypothetical protein WAL75_17305 [Terracidiphilus sp.]
MPRLEDRIVIVPGMRYYNILIERVETTSQVFVSFDLCRNEPEKNRDGRIGGLVSEGSCSSREFCSNTLAALSRTEPLRAAAVNGRSACGSCSNGWDLLTSRWANTLPFASIFFPLK